MFNSNDIWSLFSVNKRAFRILEISSLSHSRWQNHKECPIGSKNNRDMECFIVTVFVFLANNGREAVIYIKNGFLIQIGGKTIKNVQIDK